MRQVDPVGCQSRRLRRFTRRSFHSPGPNHSWHSDGYDKLKPFGFGVHGAIDAFSRRILWLKVGHSNNDPDVIGNYYLQCVRSLGVCPRFLRTDCGTENGSMAALQNILSRGDNSHLYGTSILNQRIEALWSKLRRGQINFLIHLFKDLVDSGHLDLHDQLQIGCCRFAFMPCVQNVLDKAVAYWNTHHIRRSRQGEAVPGIPDELYFLSHRFHAVNHGTPVSMGDIVECEAFLRPNTIQSVTGSQILDEYFTFVMDLKGLRKTERSEDCISLYFILKQIATNGE